MDQHTRLKGLLFDFDGTLVTLDVDWPSIRAGLRELFATCGFDATFQPMTESLMAAREHCEANGRDDLYKEALRFLRDMEARGLDGAIAMPGSNEVLSDVVAGGLPFAIISNNDTNVIHAAFSRFKFPPPSLVVGRDSVRRMKPDPEGARIAMGHLKAEASETCLVGNSAYDLALGLALGMPTYLVGGRLPSEGRATQLSDLTELIPALKGRGQWN